MKLATWKWLNLQVAHKYKDLYFYHELLELLDGDKGKLETVVKNWKSSGGVFIMTDEE